MGKNAKQRIIYDKIECGGNIMKPIKEGKVREIYDAGDSLIMVATDRISCFDVILNNIIKKKGTVLTKMSEF